MKPNKICSTCKQEKPVEQFSKNRSNKDGFQERCKECVHKHYIANRESILLQQETYVSNNKEKIAASTKVYRESNKESLRDSRRKWYAQNKEEIAEKDRWRIILEKYCLTKDGYNYILKKQGGVCAVCKSEEVGKRGDKVLPLAVDHCHETGKIRGLLCFRCNSSIGRFKDDPELMRKAAEYVEDYPTHYGNVG